MNHEEAQASQAVERYTLDEMQIEERDAFEEHYFDCRVCSEGVRDGAKMMAAGRRVARETSNVVPFVPRWKAWIPAAAAAALLMVNGILLTVGQRGTPPAATNAPVMQLAETHEAIMAGASRGAAIRIEAGKPFLLPVDLDGYPRYEILLRDSARRTLGTVAVEQSQETVTLLLRSLPAGSYVLVVEGVNRGNQHTEITTQNITVQ